MSKWCLIRANKTVRIRVIMFFGLIPVGPGEAALVAGIPGRPGLRRQHPAGRRPGPAEVCSMVRPGQCRAIPHRPGDDPGRDGFQGLACGVSRGQAVATVNRALVTLRRFFGWAVGEGPRPRPIPRSRSRNYGGSSLPPRAWNVPTCGGCCGRSNCGRTCGPMPSSTFSCTPAAGSAIWSPWNCTT